MLVDMHSHSVSSEDSRATVEQYLKWIQVLRGRGYAVDAIVLTEHRKFDLDADYSLLAQQYGVVVLKGSELDTRYGHFLVYGVTPGLLQAVDFADITLDSFELMKEAKQRGGMAIPAHPGRPRTGLCDYIQQGLEVEDVTIVETLNGGNRSGENERAMELAQERGLLGTGGSDAHLASSIGACLTEFDRPIHNEADLVEALTRGKFRPVRLEETLNGAHSSEEPSNGT